ncbi:MAG: cobalamin biosynthesis protein CobQ [Candidatus Latescibacterota bacterium]|nr:ATP-binding protein [Candidatus Korarchaeota archaeon]RKY65053.1 MAG: cobalamin biosynthesis protein CobQ [Candidatus Latescibacterota bacterium]
MDASRELIKLVEGDYKLGIPTISVTGGKGGTGKSTIAINLASYFYSRGKKVLLIDADVDAPNVAILLGIPQEIIRDINVFIPKFQLDKCIKCGLCANVCREHAILFAPNKYPIFFIDLCTGCKACKIICPVNAIDDDKKTIGWVKKGKYNGIDVLSGELKAREHEPEPVIMATKEIAKELIKTNDYDIVIIDTSPGSHINVLKSLLGSDLALAVTEPTPFGVHDLNLILKLLRILDIESYVVLNRSDLAEYQQEVRNLCRKYDVEIISEIPLDDVILKSYVNQIPAVLSKERSSGTDALLKLGKKVEELIFG